ncbi:MAG: hypothetical protein AB7M05_05285 [Alphaproteobacteria bacterium]
MAAKTGGGAATASGVGYQSQVGAYFLASIICQFPNHIFESHDVVSISFETKNNIDDINLKLKNSSSIFFQVKRKISFSLTDYSELTSVIRQFCREHMAEPNDNSKFFLITTSDSSRKITGDMRAALKAFRSSSVADFERDQSKAIVEIIHELSEAINKFLGDRKKDFNSHDIIRKIFIETLDLQAGSCLEQAIILNLHSHVFLSPSLFWSKLIDDCIRFCAERKTLLSEYVNTNYGKFLGKAEERSVDFDEKEFFKIEFKDFEFPVGREVVLGIPPPELIKSGKEKLTILEFYRFDDNCEERIVFRDGKCVLKNGLEFEVIRRTATYAGMTRYLAANSSVVENKDVVLMGINSEKNYEEGICAERHRAILREAILSNEEILKCVHCAKPVSSQNADIIEITGGSKVQVGISHPDCLRPLDRLIGTLKSEFFESYDYLRNFDGNEWFKAAQRGQGVFSSQGVFQSKTVVIGWGGRESRVSPGDFLVECVLETGESEFCFQRGKIHRFTKPDAEQFSSQLGHHVSEAEQRQDPLCYSDQSKAFGPRSLLLKEIGVGEKLRKISKVRIAKFQRSVAERYSYFENWYAPLIFLRDSDNLIFSFGGSIPLLTNPLELSKYLENWSSGGVEIPDYEVMILKTDAEFDDFAAEAEAGHQNLIVNPLVNPDGTPEFIAGTMIRSVAQLIADKGISQ